MADNKEEAAHPFGGCNKLLSQYQMIGIGLLKFEDATWRRRHKNFLAFREFKEEVSFVSVEVLESYLDDLLDLDVSEEKLFIARTASWLRGLFPSLIGIFSALGVGLYVASSGASLLFSFAVTVGLALPFGFLLHLFPQGGLSRRMFFAQIVSHEVGRRRGRDTHSDRRISSGTVLGEILGKKVPGSAQGAAKEIYH